MTTPRKPGALAIILFVIYALLLVGIVLFKFPFQYQLTEGGRSLNLIPFSGSFSDARLGLGEVIENVLVFVPLGIYVSMLRGGWSVGRRILAVVAVSVLFEIVQYAFAIGRADITDVIGNTVGGLAGIGFYALVRLILRQRTDRVLSIAALVITIVALVFFGFLRLHSK
jgi:glycopeptide antibiotics resistance protein